MKNEDTLPRIYRIDVSLQNYNVDFKIFSTLVPAQAKSLQKLDPKKERIRQGITLILLLISGGGEKLRTYKHDHIASK
ncbi:hypothetical protein Mapa_015398 [Marchantia paleacea]|nr:hypothetical protein Mapa_015398 [Marchantia paleacea]